MSIRLHLKTRSNIIKLCFKVKRLLWHDYKVFLSVLRKSYESTIKLPFITIILYHLRLEVHIQSDSSIIIVFKNDVISMVI